MLVDNKTLLLGSLRPSGVLDVSAPVGGCASLLCKDSLHMLQVFLSPCRDSSFRCSRSKEGSAYTAQENQHLELEKERSMPAIAMISVGHIRT